jgi:hypothetical protein
MKSPKQQQIIIDETLIAHCGLYCAACGSYLKGKCPGCRENSKAAWCKVRQCNIENKLQSCADCKTIELKECKKYNSFISKTFGYIMNSDRSACIRRIKEIGYSEFAVEMSAKKMQSFKRS